MRNDQRRIGRYQIVRRLGRGGFGIVYEAFDPVTHRAVALKTLTEAIDSEEIHKFRSKFVSEFRILGKLDHPFIVGVLDADFEGEELFYTMPLMASTLRNRLLEAKRKPLSIAETRSIVEPVAEALMFAHRHGITHRDVKPSNILLRESDGRWCLGDFGIALMEGQQTHSSILRTGSMAYASPEQCEAKTTGPASDVYSLACVAYECLTGKLPFEAESDFAIGIAKLTKAAPDIRILRPEIPTELGDALAEALEQNFEKRLADPKRLAAAFSSLTEDDLAYEEEPRDATRKLDSAGSQQATSEDSTRQVRVEHAETIEPKAKEEGYFFGLDLGTCNLRVCVASFWDDDLDHEQDVQFEMAPLKDQGRTVCAVHHHGTDRATFGTSARTKAEIQPEGSNLFPLATLVLEAGRNDGKAKEAANALRLLLDETRRGLRAYGVSGRPVAVSIPSDMGQAARRLLLSTLHEAGWEVRNLFTTPSTVALGALSIHGQEGNGLVIDFGGGSMTAAIVDFGSGVVETRDRICSRSFGGRCFDEAIAGWASEEFRRQHQIDLREDEGAWNRLLAAAERTKMELSTIPTSALQVPYVVSATKGPLSLDLSLSRTQFETLIAPVVRGIKAAITDLLERERFTIDDIDCIALVGGGAKMPSLREAVRQVMGKEPLRIIDPDTVVARGLALYASYGHLWWGDGVALLESTTLPIGVETAGGDFDVLIKRGSTIPTRVSRVYTTAEDKQTSVEIRVFEGNEGKAHLNARAGTYLLEGIPPMPARTPQVEVTFDIDSRGNLTVTAIEKSTGIKQLTRMS